MKLWFSFVQQYGKLLISYLAFDVYSVGHNPLSRGSQWDAVFSLTKA